MINYIDNIITIKIKNEYHRMIVNGTECPLRGFQ